jgi:hypothetical protein
MMDVPAEASSEVSSDDLVEQTAKYFYVEDLQM